jgi:hypothetical protein
MRFVGGALDRKRQATLGHMSCIIAHVSHCGHSHCHTMAIAHALRPLCPRLGRHCCGRGKVCCCPAGGECRQPLARLSGTHTRQAWNSLHVSWPCLAACLAIPSCRAVVLHSAGRLTRKSRRSHSEWDTLGALVKQSVVAELPDPPPALASGSSSQLSSSYHAPQTLSA